MRRHDIINGQLTANTAVLSVGVVFVVAAAAAIAAAAAFA